MTSVGPESRENVSAGISWMLFASFWFVSMDTVGKYLLQTYPVMQVVWCRFLFHFLIALAVALTSLQDWADDVRGEQPRSARAVKKRPRSIEALVAAERDRFEFISAGLEHLERRQQFSMTESGARRSPYGCRASVAAVAAPQLTRQRADHRAFGFA
jgi:hypothetical protein